MAYLPGTTVEYYSASLNQWIPACVVGPGRTPGCLDLDCKADVDYDRVRLPGTFVASSPSRSAAAPRPAAGPAGAPAAQGQAQGPLRLCPGEMCFYMSTSHGWIAARVVRYRVEDQTYDLDAKHQVVPAKIFCLQPRAAVEYLSSSSEQWIPAALLRPGQAPDTYDLDVKAGVHVSRIRPPEGMRCQGALAVSFALPSPKLEQLREAVETRDPAEIRRRVESESALHLVGEELDRANHALWMLEAQPEAIRELRRAAAGSSLEALQLALDAAAATGVAEPELEAASRRLRDLKSRTWRYVRKDKHLDLRQEPNTEGKRVHNRLDPGESFLVSEERCGPEGVLYLKLADGRGWAFDHKPGAGRMCERRYPEEEVCTSVGQQGGSRLGKTVAELRGLQRGCLKATRGDSGYGGALEGIAETGEDGPGIYIITEEVAVTPAVQLCGETEILTKLRAGIPVRVLEVSYRADMKRMRGRLSSPAGWISLVDTQSGKRWATRQP